MDLIERLKMERAGKVHAIYYVTQIQMAYNSNKIEGSRLSEEQTRLLYETRTILSDENGSVRLDDVLEAENHFRAFDLILDCVSDPITEDFLKELHRVLKRGTSDENNPLKIVGDYKKFPNVIGSGFDVVETAKPDEVHEKVSELLKNYEDDCKNKKSDLQRLAAFHVDFETIHPFSDGNGRIGRLLLCKECLRNGVMPFVLAEQYRGFYYQGLDEFRKGDPERLVDVFGASQDNYESFLKKMEFTDEINDSIQR
jgi:Fic family protein